MSIQRAKKGQTGYQRIKNKSWAIFLISILGLFFEMLLIRWVGTEVRIFAYLQNTVLIACFLGLGLGCFTSVQPIKFKDSLIPLTILLSLMAFPKSREILGLASVFLSVLEDLVIWGGLGSMGFINNIVLVAVGLLITYFLLILIVDMFVPMGRLLARTIDEYSNTITAYSINITGSLIGTWLFVLLSFFFQPPITWFLVTGGLMMIFIIWMKDDLITNLALLIAIIILSWFASIVPGSVDVIWSPYQKLVLDKFEINNEATGDYSLNVNNTWYQGMFDLSYQRTSSDPVHFPPEMVGFSQYDLPLLLHPNPSDYLIVGAGSGNDAAGALRHGVKNITAVEIDPAIIEIGKRYHPEKPYESENIEIIIDDARSFFMNTSQTFDVISFGLLDSHTTTAMTNARLDHYVYTQESIALAKTLLNDGGIITLTFEAQKPFIADRIARVLMETFGQKPIIFRVPITLFGPGGVMFVAGNLDTVQRQLEKNVKLSGFINQLQQSYPINLPNTTKITTDNWPYIYLESPKIPILFYLLAGLFGLVFLRSSRKWRIGKIYTRWGNNHWHFFFLGAAFLLLEVQNISKASVVLGNTWKTNAVIISGVLLMILIANWFAEKYTNINSRLFYYILIISTLTLYFVDLSKFAPLPGFQKAIIVGGLTTLPMFFSGVIFIRSFSSVDNKDQALGANLVGSIFGALLQSTTFIIGIKALLLIVAGFYVCSYIFKPSQPKNQYDHVDRD